jgi:hypothetical protein
LAHNFRGVSPPSEEGIVEQSSPHNGSQEAEERELRKGPRQNTALKNVPQTAPPTYTTSQCCHRVVNTARD